VCSSDLNRTQQGVALPNGVLNMLQVHWRPARERLWPSLFLNYINNITDLLSGAVNI